MSFRCFLALLLVVVVFAVSCSATSITEAVGFGFQSSGLVENDEFYNFNLKALTPAAAERAGGKDGKLSFERFRNKVVLITNVASACGYTQSNYEQLVKLKAKYGNDLEILLLPSNDFGKQESGTAKEIESFILMQGDEANKFIMLEKQSVNGPNQSALIKWLKQVTKTEQRDIKWNFETKFIVSKDGKLVSRYSESYSPLKLALTIDHFLKQEL